MKYAFSLVYLFFSTLSALASPESLDQDQIRKMESSRAPTKREVERFHSLSPRNVDIKSYAIDGEFSWENWTLQAVLRVQFLPLQSGLSTLELDSKVNVLAVKDIRGRDLSYQVNQELGTLSIDISSLTNGVPRLTQISITYSRHANELSDNFATGLIAIPPRPGSDLETPILYVKSEPTSTSEWMPSNMDPNDRARFQIRMRVKPRESLEANGRLIEDESVGGDRLMSYSTDYEIPPYLMAFAIGEFRSVESSELGFPVRVVARSQYVQNLNHILQKNISFMRSFERLLGAYPYEKYVLLLLPEYPGGMEHVGITFACEECISNSLWAHELAHQWHGDLVTLVNWDDLWVKEGMATLLSLEALRSTRDRRGTGITFTRQLVISDHEPAIDPALPPSEKYTTGPYGRAAFFHNQIRISVGEEVFWETQRRILSENRFGAISTETYLSYFEPLMDADRMQKLKRALFSSKLPNYEITKDTQGNFTFEVHETEDFLIVPDSLTIHRMDGTETTVSIPINQAIPLSIEGVNYWVFDPTNHALLLSAQVSEASRENYREWLNWTVPKENVIASILSENGVIQRDIITAAQSQIVATPQEFSNLFSRLDSITSERMLITNVCTYLAQADTQISDEWRRAVTDAFSHADHTEFGYSNALAACRSVLAPETLARIDASVSDSRSVRSLLALDFYSWMDLGAPDLETALNLFSMNSYANWSTVSKYRSIDLLLDFLGGATPEDKTRIEDAMVSIGLQIGNSFPLDSILSYFEDQVEVRASLFQAVILNPMLLPSTRAGAFCKAKKSLSEDPTKWEIFRTPLRDSADFTVNKLLAREELCN